MRRFWTWVCDSPFWTGFFGAFTLILIVGILFGVAMIVIDHYRLNAVVDFLNKQIEASKALVPAAK